MHSYYTKSVFLEIYDEVKLYAVNKKKKKSNEKRLKHSECYVDIDTVVGHWFHLPKAMCIAMDNLIKNKKKTS